MLRAGPRGVLAEDVFDAVVVFDRAAWVGSAADNPTEAELALPAGVLAPQSGVAWDDGVAGCVQVGVAVGGGGGVEASQPAPPTEDEATDSGGGGPPASPSAPSPAVPRRRGRPLATLTAGAPAGRVTTILGLTTATLPTLRPTAPRRARPPPAGRWRRRPPSGRRRGWGRVGVAGAVRLWLR